MWNLDLPRSSDPKMSRFFHAYLAVLEGRAFINMFGKGLAHHMNIRGVKKGNQLMKFLNALALTPLPIRLLIDDFSAMVT